MDRLSLKVLDAQGNVLSAVDAATQVSLVYDDEYRQGDRIALEASEAGRFCVVQFEDTMPPALVYLKRCGTKFLIPFGQERTVYSPKCFTGRRHVLRARFAAPAEIAARRNLALNPYDLHGESGAYPHASANVETRGEAVFAARNAIDGIFENSCHGEYPFQSWGINCDPNAEWKLEFGRPVKLDEIRLTLRGDYPHDNHWVKATLEFSDGSREILPLTDSLQPQRFPFAEKTVEWLLLKELIPSPDVSPFLALTQIEAYGKEAEDHGMWK